MTNPAGSPVGPRAIALLGLTAAIGIGLAAHGWSTRHTGAYGSFTAPTAGAPAATPTQSATAAPSSSQSPSSSGPQAPGPLLNSQSYAQYAFQVWPGTPSSTAKLAETGLSISVKTQSGGVSVTAGVAGQAAGPSHFYASGAKVYVVEAALGDDSGNADYNLGDDGLVVTDAQGRIVQ